MAATKSPTGIRRDTRNAAVRQPEEAPAAWASEILLELGHKRVLRELHDVEEVGAAKARWERDGYRVVVGEPVVEDALTAALVTSRPGIHTVRPLERHPVIERLVALFGAPARRVLLEPSSPVYRALCDRYDADRAPEMAGERAGEDGAALRQRQVLYVSRRGTDAAKAAGLDRMAADDAHADEAVALGELLGYPRCCVDAFVALDRRWPNSLPIAAAARRTKRFTGRLNNLALDRFAWIAWFPCAYDCAASLVLADAVAEHLSATHPQLVAAIDATLALPRVYLSDDEQAVLEGARWASPGHLSFDRLRNLDAVWPRRRAARTASSVDKLASVDNVLLEAKGPRFRVGERAISTPPRALVLPFGLDPP